MIAQYITERKFRLFLAVVHHLTNPYVRHRGSWLRRKFRFNRERSAMSHCVHHEHAFSRTKEGTSEQKLPVMFLKGCTRKYN